MSSPDLQAKLVSLLVRRDNYNKHSTPTANIISATPSFHDIDPAGKVELGADWWSRARATPPSCIDWPGLGACRGDGVLVVWCDEGRL